MRISGLERLCHFFERVRANAEGGLGTYICAGDPSLRASANILRQLPSAGAGLIELGFPFSDPIGDGPIIQASHMRSLAGGTKLRQVLDLVSEFRRADGDTPLILMGYINPILSYGYEKFASDAAAAGVDGFILIDLPPDEGAEFRELCTRRGMANILIVALSTPPARMQYIAKMSSGFVYFAATSGITGVGAIDADQTRQRVAALRCMTDLPIGVGFGIRSARDVSNVRQFADLALVGSALVQAIAEAEPNRAADAARQFVSELAGHTPGGTRRARRT